MTIYTITIVNQRHGWVAHVENHSNAQQAEERIEYLEQKWNKAPNYDYLIEMHTTQIKAAQQ
tara:strand:- start:25 stop:210 length:186 start_codon:yes stop_codon:yes gene_type:complete